MLIDKKHGLAPALTFCGICGKDTNDLLFLGSECHKIMKNLYQQTGGKYGNKDGYTGNSTEKLPSQEPCEDCKSYLTGGGIIFVALDSGQYLQLTKEQADDLVGKIWADETRCLDIEGLRGKICQMKKAWWTADEEGNIRLRDPKEWAGDIE